MKFLSPLAGSGRTEILYSLGLTPSGYFLSPYGLAAEMCIRGWA
jgi:hypothetical protein